MNFFNATAQLFVSNRKLSTLLFVALALWGAVAFVLTPKQYNPDIVAPAFLIRVQAPGMTAREVLELVTKPLENVVHELPGVEDIYSQSLYGGESRVTVRFYVGEDMERSMIRLRQRLDSNLDLKPVGAEAPSIKTIDPDDLPVMTLGLVSPELSPATLRRVAFELKDRLKTVSGTSILEVSGGQKKELQVVLDSEKMLASKTDVREIDQALDRTSLLRELGSVKATDFYYPVELHGTVANLQELQDLTIVSNVTVGLKAKDVGDVKEGVSETNAHLDFYGGDGRVEDVVLLSVAKQPGVNIVALSRRIHDYLNQISGEPFLEGSEIRVLRDEGQVAREEIGGLTTALLQAIVIIFFVLFLFLNVRAAVLVAVNIPLTLLTVFGLGWMAGYTINRITLFALILSLGLLVDSATVVIENIFRNHKNDPEKPIAEVIGYSAAEVGPGLLLSTLTTILAFIPMAFVTGMMGPYMGPIPFFVPAALIVALLFAYTLNPWLASIAFRDGGKKGGSEKLQKRKIGVLGERLLNAYENGMRGLFKSPFLRYVLMAAGAVLLISALLLPVLRVVKFRMLPKADRNHMYVYVDLDRGTSIEKTREITGKLSDSLTRLPEVENVVLFAGRPPVLDFNGMFKGANDRSGTNQATLRLNLTHFDTRDLKSEELAVRFREKIEEVLSDVSDARFQIIEDPPGPPVLATFLVKVKGRDQALIRDVSEDLKSRFAQIKGVVDLDTTNAEPLLKYKISVDREIAAAAQVSTADIARTLSVVYEGSKIGVYHDDKNLEQQYIVLKFPRSKRFDIEDLDGIFISNELGNQIPVKKFLKIEEAESEPLILSDNRMPVVYISGEMENRSVTYAAMDALRVLSDYSLPGMAMERTGFSLFGSRYRLADGRTVEIEIGGEWDLTLDVFRDLGLAMAVAIFLVYCVMVIQFRSYMIPFLILGTIPLSLIGVFPGFALLYLTGKVCFSATSMIGVIALAGIVVNNAIILMEYVLQSGSNSEKSIEDRIIDACKTRLRPIFLTSLTTVLGTLMIVSDPVWAGLAWSIVFGLSLSTVLTLVFFPVLLYHFKGRSLA